MLSVYISTLQGSVELQDGDGHVIEVELNAAADSLEILNDVTVTKHVTEIDPSKSALLINVVRRRSIRLNIVTNAKNASLRSVRSMSE